MHIEQDIESEWQVDCEINYVDKETLGVFSKTELVRFLEKRGTGEILIVTENNMILSDETILLSRCCDLNINRIISVHRYSESVKNVIGIIHGTHKFTKNRSNGMDVIGFDDEELDDSLCPC